MVFKGLLKRMELEEIKAQCNCPSKFQIMDYFGAAFGILFFIDGAGRIIRVKKDTGKISAGAVMELFFGSVAFYLHSRRFVYAEDLGIRKGGRFK